MTACFDGSFIFFDTLSTRVQGHVFAVRLRGLIRAVFVLDAVRPSVIGRQITQDLHAFVNRDLLFGLCDLLLLTMARDRISHNQRQSQVWAGYRAARDGHLARGRVSKSTSSRGGTARESRGTQKPYAPA